MGLIPSSRLHVTAGPPPTRVLAALRSDVARTFVALIPSTTVRGLLALLATGLLWGLVVVGPEFVPEASATSIVGGRFVVLGLASAILGRRRLRGIDWPRAARYAVAGFTGYYLLLVLGIQRAGAAPVAAVIGITPVVYAIVGARRERLDVRRLAGPLAVMLLGIGVVNLVDLRSVGAAGAMDLLVGLGFAAASVVVWIWYGLDNGRYVRTSGIGGTRWTSAVGVAAGVMAVPLLVHGLTIGGGVGRSPETWLMVVVVLGLGSAWLGTVAWNAASTLLPESVIGPLLVVELAVGLVYAHLFAHSWPAPVTMAGYVLLGAGVVLSVVRVDALRVSAAAAADA